MELARRLSWFHKMSHTKWRIVILTFLATGLAVLLIANLSLGDKVIDERVPSVGSTNFDTRSFSTNDEANLNVYDRKFAAAQLRIFEDDLKRSRRIALEEWQNRPLTEKAWEHTMGLLSSQL